MMNNYYVVGAYCEGVGELGLGGPRLVGPSRPAQPSLGPICPLL
jgi:hypothetical protein